MKNGDGRGSLAFRQAHSEKARKQIENGTNGFMAEVKKRQAKIGGDKNTLLCKELKKIDTDPNDELHGLVTTDVPGDYACKYGGWSIDNSGGDRLKPGVAFRVLSLRLRFDNVTKFKYWFTSDSKKERFGPQKFKWSDDTKHLAELRPNSTPFMQGTLKFVRIS